MLGGPFFPLYHVVMPAFSFSVKFLSHNLQSCNLFSSVFPLSRLLVSDPQSSSFFIVVEIKHHL